MEYITLIVIAFGLSFDSFAVAVCSGLSLCKKTIKLSTSIKIAGSFALFQALFPLIGWLIGNSVKDFVEHADHWIAFVLLAFLGIRMIIEGRKPIENKRIKNPDHWKILITLSIATSIDALMVGISFAFFVENMTIAVLTIGMVTFVVALIGIYIGQKSGKKLASKAEMLGGIILILIGLKILIEHLIAESAIV